MRPLLVLFPLVLCSLACGTSVNVFGEGADGGGESSSGTSTAPRTDTNTAGGGGAGGGSNTGGSQGGVAVDPMCGDGTVDAGEECDDGDDVAGDGCTDCIVDCPANADSKKEPTTFHCYQYFDMQQTWAGAGDACVALGSGWDFAALSTIAERDFVVDVISQASITWVGAADSADEGQFVWTNGEAFTHQDGAPFWALGEPNDDFVFADEDCVSVNSSGAASDRGCDGSYGYLCEHTPLSGP